MKKFFIILGSIFFAVIVLAAIGIAFLAVRGGALDKESKAYVDSAIPAIVATWSEKELLDRASPELKKAATIEEVDRLFRWFSSLGRLQKYEGAQGQSLMSATTQNGKMISAQYTAKATFEKGEATITVDLIKHGDQWQVLKFNLRSPQLAPR